MMSDTVMEVRGQLFRHHQVGDGYPIVVLHGWGSSIDAWVEVQDLLASTGFSSHSIELPGFGQSPPPPRPWSLVDYAEFVDAAIAACGLSRFALIGHSFGGRIAIKLAARRDAIHGLEHLTLVASAGLRAPLSVKQRVIVFAARAGRLVSGIGPLYRLEPQLRRAFYSVIGTRDYTRAEGTMRETMRLVLAEDLRDMLGRITVPTLILWGDADRVTPLADGKEIHALIRASILEVVRGGTHRLPYEQPELFTHFIHSSLASKRESGHP